MNLEKAVCENACDLTALIDQPTLYALFDLVLSVAGDAGIAASSALTRAFLISSLSGLPGTIPNRDEVSQLLP